MSDRKIPDFASREEMAEFWDTQDLTDVLDELTPARAHVAAEVEEPLSEVTQVRLTKSVDDKLTTYARERGIKKSTLLRMIALEWLRDHERHAS